MTNMRHNFSANDRLSQQLLGFFQNFLATKYANICTENLQCDIVRYIENDWHSATYEGKIRTTIISISSPNHQNVLDIKSDHIREINILIGDYIFQLPRSFVADIKVRHCPSYQKKPLTHDIFTSLEIETLVINEE